MAIAEEKLVDEKARAEIGRYYQWTRERRARVLAKWSESQLTQTETDVKSVKTLESDALSKTTPRTAPHIEAEMKSLTSAVAPAQADKSKDKEKVSPESKNRHEFVSSALDAQLRDASARCERARQSVEHLRGLEPPKFPSRNGE
jgi:hypothetical protein